MESQAYKDAYDSLHGDQLSDLPTVEELQEQERLVEEEVYTIFLERAQHGECSEEEAELAYGDWYRLHHPSL